MSKIVIFAFKGDFMRFIHVLLNALDLNEKGIETKIVIEGEATKLISELVSEKSPLYNLFKKVREKNLVAGVCKLCSQKMGTLESPIKEGFTILEDMNRHAGMAPFIKQGYIVITLYYSLIKKLKRGGEKWRRLK